jgi:colicin import membrane protein
MTPKNQARRTAGRQKSNKRTFLYSLAAHVVVLSALFIGTSKPKPIQQRPSGPQVVQKSTTVSNLALQKEIAAVKSERLARINAEKRQVRTLRSKQANIQRKLRQKQLAVSAQQKRLAKLRQVQRHEKKQLTALQQKQRAAQTSFKSQQKRLSSTAQKLKALRKQQQAVSNAVRKQKLAQQARELAEKMQQQQLAAEKSRLQQRRLQEGIISRYRAQILAAIQQHWSVPRGVQSGMKSTFLVQLGGNGSVEKVSLAKSSGSAVLDRSARVALFKASPLPIPKDPALNKSFRSIRLVVAPPGHY